LIEHFAGAFPAWLAPVQMRVLPITDVHEGGAARIVERLASEGWSVELDARNDTLSYRIRDAELQKVPYVLVVGDRELEAGTVALRVRGVEKKQQVMPLDEFVERAREVIEARSLEL
ncbi:MAG TPA: His/Gly/Thr/Pro-type tRNA ligase C-terminal domain-containing protein, partial [Gemmatimonadota bacterium]|nr:His/Gly/Thr/Pro-type tRNA ligase C-terminal domain-containing protein [Gemmatimonadota bacterium]